MNFYVWREMSGFLFEEMLTYRREINSIITIININFEWRKVLRKAAHHLKNTNTQYFNLGECSQSKPNFIGVYTMNKKFIKFNITGLILLMLLAGITGTVLAAPNPAGMKAGAGLAFTDRFHDEGADEIEDFCGETGLTVQHTYSVDMFVHIVPHGTNRFDYYLQHGVWTDTYTSQEKTITAIANVTEKDHLITDNGDGKFTIVILATGNATAYGPDGKAIARNPGQLRFVVYIAADGSLTFGDVVKGSTGRSDDFCEAALAALAK